MPADSNQAKVISVFLEVFLFTNIKNVTFHGIKLKKNTCISNQVLSGKDGYMSYELHTQSGSLCAVGVLLQSSSYIIRHSKCKEI